MFELIGWFVFILSIITGLMVIVAIFVGIYSIAYLILDILFNIQKYSCPNCKVYCRMVKVEPQNDMYDDFVCPKCGHEFYL